MFAAAGPRAAAFCEWVRKLGEPAETLRDRLPGGVRLVHLDARSLLGAADGASLRGLLDHARRQGVPISIDLGPAEWIRAHGSSRVAYQLATMQPDILFVGQPSASELDAPLEGIASIPVLTLGDDGCAVYSRRLMAPAGSRLDADALAAAFCVAYVEGAAPVEAAGRAVLIATMKLAP